MRQKLNSDVSVFWLPTRSVVAVPSHLKRPDAASPFMLKIFIPGHPRDSLPH